MNNTAFTVLAWAALLAVYLNACLDLTDRFHAWRASRKPAAR